MFDIVSSQIGRAFQRRESGLYIPASPRSPSNFPANPKSPTNSTNSATKDELWKDRGGFPSAQKEDFDDTTPCTAPCNKWENNLNQRRGNDSLESFAKRNEGKKVYLRVYTQTNTLTIANLVISLVRNLQSYGI